MKLALGTVQFGMSYGVANVAGCVPEQEVGLILARARDYGIDLLDTAISYGKSESSLGCFDMGSWKIVTKLPAVPEGCLDVDNWVCDQINESMIRLGVKKLHGILLHAPDQLLKPVGSDIYESLKALKAQGLVRKIGVSVYAPCDLEPLIGRYEIDLVQAPINILDRRLIETGWAERLHKMGVEIHARSVFLQGLLLMHEAERPSKFKIWANVWDEWSRWLAESNMTPLEACLRYVQNLQHIDRILIGVETVAQLDQIVGAAKGPLVELPKFRALDDNRLINPGCWSDL